VVALASVAANAAVTFDEASNVIRVADYPEDAPCTLRMLSDADRANGWGKVVHDEAGDTYTVTATLVIGENDRGNTFFRIGSKDHPRETLVMKGGLIIMPPFVSGVNSDLKWAGVLMKQGREVTWNGLVMGDPNDPGIAPSLKIATDPPFHTNRLCAGVFYPGKKTGYRAKLHIYNGTIEPLESNSVRRIDSQLYCELRVRHSRMRGFRKSFFYGVRGDWAEIADSVFEDCYKGPINTGNKTLQLRNCTLRDCDIGFGEWGGRMNLELVDCVLTNNVRNWAVHRGTVRLIDCTLGRGAKGNTLSHGLEHEKPPEVIVFRHVVVEVTDPDGHPVPGATVMVIPEQFDPELVPCKVTTGQNGKTPGRDAGEAILVRECAWKAVPGRLMPERADYTYEIVVEAKGFPEKSTKGFRATGSWQVAEMKLERTVEP
jgi:hypothetical protein